MKNLSHESMAENALAGRFSEATGVRTMTGTV